MNVCYIVGAADFFEGIKPDENDFVIAADGGFDSLIRHGIKADLLIGDMDSVKSDFSGIDILRFSEKKDETDILLAFLEGKRRGYKSFRIYGATGGRQDHTFANYCLLSYIKEQGCNARIYSPEGMAVAIKDEQIEILGKAGSYISIFAFGKNATGVSISGLEYELENATLYPYYPLGVSNKFKNSAAKISVEDGTLLIMWQN